MTALSIGYRCGTELHPLGKQRQAVGNSDSSNKLCISLAGMAGVPIDSARTLLTRWFNKRRCRLGGGHPACSLSQPEHSMNTSRQGLL